MDNSVDNSLSPDDIERILWENLDLIPVQWKNRHAKFIQRFGADRYREHATKARVGGKPPKKLMAYLINKDLKENQDGEGK